MNSSLNRRHIEHEPILVVNYSPRSRASEQQTFDAYAASPFRSKNMPIEYLHIPELLSHRMELFRSIIPVSEIDSTHLSQRLQ